jgi:uncharacterized surface protein with fasciclin (FAS1) repeats
MFKSAGCNKKREVFKNTLWKIISWESPQILFHGVNDYYDTGLKYARLAETGIGRDAEQWHKKVQSTKYENYSFVRMNLEDREQLLRLTIGSNGNFLIFAPFKTKNQV